MHIFSFSQENRLWYFMQIAIYMECQSLFSGKKNIRKIFLNICCWMFYTAWRALKWIQNDKTQQAHDVNTTSPQRRCNVMTLHRRWIDVLLTSCARWECTYLRNCPSSSVKCTPGELGYGGFRYQLVTKYSQESSQETFMKSLKKVTRDKG